MNVLSDGELKYVAAGELQCTAGTSGVNCTGSLSDWSKAISSAYNAAVDATTDFFCWLGGV